MNDMFFLLSLLGGSRARKLCSTVNLSIYNLPCPCAFKFNFLSVRLSCLLSPLLPPPSFECLTRLNYLLIYYIFIIKQDVRIYVTDSRPNGGTELVDIFCGHSGVAAGRLKKICIFF